MKIGVVEIIITILYLIPRTSFVGAILLTAYLGGATEVHVRANESFPFPIIPRDQHVDRTRLCSTALSLIRRFCQTLAIEFHSLGRDSNGETQVDGRGMGFE